MRSMADILLDGMGKIGGKSMSPSIHGWFLASASFGCMDNVVCS